MHTPAPPFFMAIIIAGSFTTGMITILLSIWAREKRILGREYFWQVMVVWACAGLAAAQARNKRRAELTNQFKHEPASQPELAR